MVSKTRKVFLAAGFFFATVAVVVGADSPRVGVCVSTLYPQWQYVCGRCFPADMIASDLAKAGVTDLFYFINSGRDLEWNYAADSYAERNGHMAREGKDWFGDLLTACDREKQKVWAAISYPTELHGEGLDHPEIVAYFVGKQAELIRKYKRHASFAGFVIHEFNGVETGDNHLDELKAFDAFCEKRFGEPYREKAMPVNADPANKWWRRFFLYKIQVLSDFVAALARQAHEADLKIGFFLYETELSGGESWRFGYDALALAKICDWQWHLAIGQGGKPYYCFQQDFFDFGPTYTKMDRSRNYAYAFHGRNVSFFEYSAPFFMEETRSFYQSPKMEGWRKTYGDYYFDHKGWTKKSLSLFAGKDRMKSWINLMTAWHGGNVGADIAFAVGPNAFIQRFPINYGSVYADTVAVLAEGLTTRMDLGGLLFDSPLALDPDRSLAQYKTIIVPESMGEGISAAMAASAREYLKKGGKILSVATALTQTREDLTGPIDLTAELLGARVLGKETGRDFRPVGAGFDGEKNYYLPEIRAVALAGGEIVVKDASSGQALVVAKNNGYFCAVPYSGAAAPFFAALIENIHKPAISLENSTGVKLLESTLKDGALCLSFYYRGTAVARVRPNKLGMVGPRFQVRNILTGKVLLETDAAGLEKGFFVAIREPREPLILAVGTPARLAPFKGIFPPEEDFKGLADSLGEENPQVQILIPNEPGLKVAVYHRGWAAEGIVRALKSRPGFNAFLAPRIDVELLGKIDVLVIPQTATSGYITEKAGKIREFVENGGGALLVHPTVPYGADGKPIFPEIGKMAYKIRYKFLDADNATRLVEAFGGLPKGAEHKPAFQFDNVVMEVGPKGKVMMTETAKNLPVAIGGEIGKGRVMLYGMLLGSEGDKTDASGAKRVDPAGAELDALAASLRWIGKVDEKAK